MMSLRFRKYRPDDFLKIRGFLVANYKRFEHPVNWDLVRWNYARYLCAPMLGAWGLGEEKRKVPDTSGKLSEEAVRFWESSIGVWETGDGEITGVVCPDEYLPWHLAFGQAFLQRSPNHEDLLPQMLGYAEKTFIGKNMTRIYVGEHDKALQDAVGARGFVRDAKPCMNYMEFDLADIPDSALPEGYKFVSMAENNDIEKHREVGGLSFNHPDPNDWPTAYSYR